MTTAAIILLLAVLAFASGDFAEGIAFVAVAGALVLVLACWPQNPSPRPRRRRWWLWLLFWLKT